MSTQKNTIYKGVPNENSRLYLIGPLNHDYVFRDAGFTDFADRDENTERLVVQFEKKLIEILEHGGEVASESPVEIKQQASGKAFKDLTSSSDKINAVISSQGSVTYTITYTNRNSRQSGVEGGKSENEVNKSKKGEISCTVHSGFEAYFIESDKETLLNLDKKISEFAGEVSVPVAEVMLNWSALGYTFIASVNNMEQQVSNSTSSNSKKVIKIISVIVGVFVAILLIIYVSTLSIAKNNTDKNSKNTMQQNSNSQLSTEEILTSPRTINGPGGDYFTGTPDEQKKIIERFVKDNSDFDSAFLYIAANTAYRIGEIKNAAFLFYAAQIRKAFDYTRFNIDKLEKEQGSGSISVYIGFLNFTTSQAVNEAIFSRPKEFSEVRDMIKAWDVVPKSDEIYTELNYGDLIIPKEEWQKTADDVKQKFMDVLLNRYSDILNDPVKSKMFYFVRDYNTGKIEQTVENTKKFEEYTKALK